MKFPTSVCTEDSQVLTFAASAFCLASKVGNALTGTLRFGSGIIGSGGSTDVIAFVRRDPSVPGAAVCALPWSVGAGFGAGTACADDEGGISAISDAATISVAMIEAPLAIDPDRRSGFLFNASSCLASNHDSRAVIDIRFGFAASPCSECQIQSRTSNSSFA